MLHIELGSFLAIYTVIPGANSANPRYHTLSSHMLKRRFLHTRGIAQQQLHSQPCFIMGHPRTGTTHLHNLLALDPAFSYANTFDAGVGMVEGFSLRIAFLKETLSLSTSCVLYTAGFPSSFVSLSCTLVKWLLAPLL